MDDRQIDELIKCPKEIVKKPKKRFKESQRDMYTLNNNFICHSTDGKYYFEVYLKRNIKFKEKFSIGLLYYPRIANEPEKVMLVRCNGSHEHKNKIINKDKFDNYHIHMANEKQIKLGFDLKFDAAVAKYDNFDTALEYFMKLCNIEDWENYFNVQDDSQMTWDEFRG